MTKLSKPMLRSRKAKMNHGKGEAWFYVCPNGIEVEVADEKGAASQHSLFITRKQLERALKIIARTGDEG